MTRLVILVVSECLCCSVNLLLVESDIVSVSLVGTMYLFVLWVRELDPNYFLMLELFHTYLKTISRTKFF